jgi:ABC-2 type transport system permease protein
MRNTFVVAKRELMSLFFSPIAYVVMGIFGFGATLLFLLQFSPGQPATMRGVFDAVSWFLVFLAPAISMRLVSEEYRTNTIEMLMTSPASDAQLIVGKWMGALGFFAALLSPLVVLLGVLCAFSRPDYGPVVTGFIGLMLVGGFYLAIGVFASSLTQNQIIAFLITVFVILFFSAAVYYVAQLSFLQTAQRQAILYLSVNEQAGAFSRGTVFTSNLVYFASFIAFFLFLATKSLESRRWR